MSSPAPTRDSRATTHDHSCHPPPVRRVMREPPAESGSSATYIATLSDDEIAGRWVPTCQAVPTTPSVRVVYE